MKTILSFTHPKYLNQVFTNLFHKHSHNQQNFESTPQALQYDLQPHEVSLQLNEYDLQQNAEIMQKEVKIAEINANVLASLNKLSGTTKLQDEIHKKLLSEILRDVILAHDLHAPRSFYEYVIDRMTEAYIAMPLEYYSRYVMDITNILAMSYNEFCNDLQCFNDSQHRQRKYGIAQFALKALNVLQVTQDVIHDKYFYTALSIFHDILQDVSKQSQEELICALKNFTVIKLKETAEHFAINNNKIVTPQTLQDEYLMPMLEQISEFYKCTRNTKFLNEYQVIFTNIATNIAFATLFLSEDDLQKFTYDQNNKIFKMIDDVKQTNPTIKLLQEILSDISSLNIPPCMIEVDSDDESSSKQQVIFSKVEDIETLYAKISTIRVEYRQSVDIAHIVHKLIECVGSINDKMSPMCVMPLIKIANVIYKNFNINDDSIKQEINGFLIALLQIVPITKDIIADKGIQEALQNLIHDSKSEAIQLYALSEVYSSDWFHKIKLHIISNTSIHDLSLAGNDLLQLLGVDDIIFEI